MSDLTAFRDHARRMAAARHTPDCARRLAKWEAAESAHRWLMDKPDPGPRPECHGCITDADRALWVRLADETDAYLARETEETLL